MELMKRTLASLTAFGALTAAQTAYAKSESWYLYPIGLGYAVPSYSSGPQAAVDAAKNTPGVSRLPLSLDLLGFYVALADNQALGFMANATNDTLSNGTQDVSLQLNQYSLSYLFSFGPETGSGFFLRADAGPARGVATVKSTGSILGTSSVSGWGWGLLAGGGYGIPISDETRILLQANYARRFVEGESYSSLAFTLGFLF
jgi:Autotransporter beta-domain